MSGFLQALPFTLEAEGGFTVDQGGPTMQGITQDTYDRWRKDARQPTRPVKEMEEGERDAIYYRYWTGAKCDALPWPLSMVHFDCAVNAGPGQAIRILQRAVGATDDGKWGDETKERVHLCMADEWSLLNNLLWERVAFYSAIASQDPKKHGGSFRGWIKRVLRLRKKAKESM